jgi:squalene-hopene/tetraprenyl-beta-curcumene cyclase
MTNLRHLCGIAFLACLATTARSNQGAQPAVPPATTTGPASTGAAQAGVDSTLDLGPDIDKALRWLRYAQDRDSGGYGPDVATTALALRALRESPRKYQAIDGPFVQRALDYLVARQAPDGSIADAGASGADRTRQTRLAAAALTLHASESNKAALGAALKHLGEALSAEPWGDEPLPESRAAVRKLATDLLSKRRSDGSWDGSARATAEAAVLLVRAAPVLKPAAAGPKGAKPLAAFEPADKQAALDALATGARFLVSIADEGKWGEPGKPDAGITAMALGALLSTPTPREPRVQSTIDAGLAWLVSLQQPDGSIHQGKVANYVTSAAVMALAADGRESHRAALLRARDWLVALQLGPEDDYAEDHPYYGGIGYGSSERPDLSNLQMALEALSVSGLDKDHEAFRRSLRFLERCQNRSERNDVRIPEGGKVVVSGDDGGSAYAPGQSMAGYSELEGGRKIPRSYGSMTYALLKSYIFAGVPKDDPRVKAASEWLRRNYTLDVNPGFEAAEDPSAAFQGLFYYFSTMARTLEVAGEANIVDARGESRSWRKDLAGRLVAIQRKDDGSWLNENSPRWYEGNPILATSYALLALGSCVRGQ